jgi:hypothetical protein
VHDQASGVDVSRIRRARASWHLSSSLGSVTTSPRYEEFARRRRGAAADVTLAVAVFWPRPHGEDTLEFHLLPPPSLIEVLRPMFNQIIGRADLSYRVASALIKDRVVEPEDWPAAAELIAGRPHFTAGVEFSIFASAMLKHESAIDSRPRHFPIPAGHPAGVDSIH